MFIEIGGQEIMINCLAIALNPLTKMLNDNKIPDGPKESIVELINLGCIKLITFEGLDSPYSKVLVVFDMPIEQSEKESELLKKISELGNNNWITTYSDPPEWFYRLEGQVEFDSEPLPDYFPANLKLHHIYRFGSRG